MVFNKTNTDRDKDNLPATKAAKRTNKDFILI